MAQQQQEFNANHIRLPRYLHNCLLKLHLTKLILGLLLLVLGISCMVKYDTNIFIIVVGASFSSFIEGGSGVLALLKRSLVLHGGATLNAAISIYLSLLAYMVCTTEAAVDNKNSWVVIVSALVLVINMLSATLNSGVELCVIYLAVSNQRETGGICLKLDQNPELRVDGAGSSEGEWRGRP